jgi:Rod binding domain-containing protein
MSDARIAMDSVLPLRARPLKAAQDLPAKALKEAASAGGLAEAAKGFESILVHRLVQSMKSSIPDSGLLSGGISRQIQDMFWFFLADEVGKKGTFGLWKQLCEQFGQNPTETSENRTMEVVR